MIVVDASAILELLLPTDAAWEVFHRLFSGDDSLHAPHLLDLEVAQVLRRYASAGELPARRGLEALQELETFGIARYAHTELLPRIWELRGNMTAYDAAYVALAEALDATLVTRDQKLADASGHRASIEVI